MYTYTAKVIRVIDGDSLWLEVDIGFRMSFKDNFRLNGIDALEWNSKSENKRQKAREARDALAFLVLGKELRITTTKPGKYGRWLADLYVISDGEEIHVNDWLVKEGHAVWYGGGKRG
jgi:micrococcal nuclease